MEYAEWMETVAKGFEIVGVAIIVIGALYAIVFAVTDWTGHRNVFQQARRNFGRPFILGLEVLVAADIVETIVLDRTLESAASLGVIVLVRVVLSFSLDIEVDGMLPWRRAVLEAGRSPVTASDSAGP